MRQHFQTDTYIKKWKVSRLIYELIRFYSTKPDTKALQFNINSFQISQLGKFLLEQFPFKRLL